MKIISYFLLSFFVLISDFAYSQKNTILSKKEIEEYKKQVHDLVMFYEGTLNFLGDKNSTAKEKDIVINESYLKIFKDDKVQIEDDLDERRETSISKDVQAYLKDVDFFFTKAKFEFAIEEIDNYLNEKGKVFFKVVLNRNLQATTINGEIVNSNKKRYIEVNLDEVKKDLKIVSIYTTRINEMQELMHWWLNLPDEWVIVLTQNIPFDANITNQQLKTIISQEEIDIAGNQKITDLSPLSKLINLKKLNIANTKINSLAALRNLTKIESFNCSNSQIVSINQLKYCFQLREFFCSNTGIEDFSIVSNFSKLEKFDCSATLIKSLGPVENLLYLKDLRFNQTEISDLKPLSKLKNLQILRCANSKISDLKYLHHAENLQFILIDNTPVADLSVLSKNISLRTISCSNTMISELKSLKNLTFLQKIECNNTQITAEIASAFMAIKPGCIVIYDSESQMNWWKSLSNDWKKVFNKYISIENQPSKEQLQLIFNLIKIDISNNRNINNLEPLKKLYNLKEIYLSNTNILTLQPLKDLTDLRIIDASNTDISSIEALSSHTNLEKLLLNQTKVTNLNHLKQLNNLAYLFFNNSLVSDVSVLDSIKNLKFVSCENIPVEIEKLNTIAVNNSKLTLIYQSAELKKWWRNLSNDWKAVFFNNFKIENNPTSEQLHKLSKITQIEFSDNYSINDLSPLKKIIALKELRFSSTQISTLDAIAGFKNLEILFCTDSPIKSLEPLKNLHNLKWLNCSNSLVKDLSPLLNLENIERLNISGTKVKSLNSLEKLSNLKVLEFYNTKVFFLGVLKKLKNLKLVKCYHISAWNCFVKKFKASNPECTVIYY